ncbi:MAG: HU family DNA-binding protein [Clostridia bacterium]|nr:HU family DNA-binding protein [Clostridia bacterium]
MNKNELVTAVSKQCGITKLEAKKSVDAVFESITKALLRGEIVSVRGFGKFWAKYCPATLKTPPSSKIIFKIPPKFVPKFCAFERLKRRFWLDFG